MGSEVQSRILREVPEESGGAVERQPGRHVRNTDACVERPERGRQPVQVVRRPRRDHVQIDGHAHVSVQNRRHAADQHELYAGIVQRREHANRIKAAFSRHRRVPPRPWPGARGGRTVLPGWRPRAARPGCGAAYARTSRRFLGPARRAPPESRNRPRGRGVPPSRWKVCASPPRSGLPSTARRLRAEPALPASTPPACGTRG